MTTADDHGRAAAEVITLPAWVEPHCVVALRNRGEEAVARAGRAMTVDLRAVVHIDTPTLSELIIALRSISRRGVTLTVLGADPRVRWVLELCGIPALGRAQPSGARARGVQRRRRPSRWRRPFRRERATLRRSG